MPIDSVDTYYTNIKNNINNNLDSLSTIDTKNMSLLEKDNIQSHLLLEIQDKQKLLLTRSRMLQISTDRNSYKLKIIYILISVAILLFIISIVIFIFLRKNK